MPEITALLHDWCHGKKTNEDELFALVYPQLRNVAGALFKRERSDSMLQPTSVVNELFLRLVTQRQLDFQDRQHFYSFAACVMRRVLADHARAEGRSKRSGGIQIPFEEGLTWAEIDTEGALDIEAALSELENLDERKCRIVELRFLLGFTADETAHILQVSKASVDRELRFARGWLRERLRPNL